MSEATEFSSLPELGSPLVGKGVANSAQIHVALIRSNNAIYQNAA